MSTPIQWNPIWGLPAVCKPYVKSHWMHVHVSVHKCALAIYDLTWSKHRTDEMCRGNKFFLTSHCSQLQPIMGSRASKLSQPTSSATELRTKVRCASNWNDNLFVNRRTELLAYGFIRSILEKESLLSVIYQFPPSIIDDIIEFFISIESLAFHPIFVLFKESNIMKTFASRKVGDDAVYKASLQYELGLLGIKTGRGEFRVIDMDTKKVIYNTNKANGCQIRYRERVSTKVAIIWCLLFFLQSS